MAKRKDILNAALKALLAGAKASAWLKIPATFIAEIASLPEDKKKQLASISPDKFEELLLQSELATTNAALAVVGTEQIKKMVENSHKLTKKQLKDLSTLTQEEFEGLRADISDLGILTDDTNKRVRAIDPKLNNLQTSVDGIHEKLDNQTTGDVVGHDQYKNCEITINPQAVEASVGTIHNIPYNSLGGLFKGRGEDFNTLVTQLEDNSSTTAITQAISGLGGMGKTRLAVEYSWNALNQGQYQMVLFVNCSQELSGKEDTSDTKQQQNRQMSAFDRLCVEMGKLGAANLLDIAGVDTMDPQPAAQTVLKELRQREEWLIVFDNVDEPAMAGAVNTVLPQLNKGKVIITSRLKNFAGTIKPLQLEKLTPDASKDYFLERTNSKRPTLDNDQGKLEELAAKLDGLPVALEQAAAYIIHQKISFEEYLQDFTEVEIDVLDFRAKDENLADYPESVLRAWLLTEQQLSDNAKSILIISSFLSPEKIPESLILNQSKFVLAIAEIIQQISQEEFDNFLAGDGYKRAVRTALAQLDSFSMITRDSEEACFSIHRLVQEVTRLRLSKNRIDTFIQLVLELVYRSSSDYQTAIKTNYAWHRTMDSHISGLIAYSYQLWPKATNVPISIAQNLATQINNLTLFYNTTNRLAEAEPLMKRSLHIYEAVLCKDHPNIATALNNLSQLYKATNRLEEAEQFILQAAKILENTGGAPLADYSGAMNNLAGIYMETNRLEGAESLMLRAIQIDEESPGKDNSKLATSLNNLAQLYMATNRKEEAKTLMLKAFNMFTEGNASPTYAAVLINLANLYKETDRLVKAEVFYLQALAIYEEYYNKKHPIVAIAINNIATLYVSTNRLSEAERLMKRAMVIFLKFTNQTGHRHPSMDTALNNYGQLLSKIGHSKEDTTALLQELAMQHAPGLLVSNGSRLIQNC